MLIITMNVAINNTMYSVHNLHTNNTKLHYKPFNFHQYLHQVFGLAYQSAFSLHLQFASSKYSPIPHDLSRIHSHILGFQINLSSHLPVSVNSLHSHLHLSLFQRCLSLPTPASNLHLHEQILCHSI